MCSLLLVCAVLKTLHSVKHILNEEECRSVGKAMDWWAAELAVVIVVKPPGALQESLGALKEYKGDWWFDRTAKKIGSKIHVSACVDTLLHTSDLTLYSLTVHCMWSK